MNEYNGMKIGDLITAYHKGFWILDKIETRETSAPLFHYTKYSDSKGKLGKGTNVCDAGYCEPAQKAVDKILNEAKQLEDIIKQFSNK